MQGVRTTISCTACKRRKKGCDFKKPKCGRCDRLGSDCVYEARAYTFIDVAHPECRLSRTPRSTSSSSTASSPRSQSSLLSTDLSLQVDAAFWDIYLPQGQDGSVFFGGKSMAPWLHAIRDLATTDEIVHLALEAVVYVGLGWWREDHAFVRKGVQTYAVVLRKVNEALQDSAQALTDATLACCRILSLFEMFRRREHGAGLETNQSLDWRKHAEGTWQLLKVRGRSQHLRGNGLKLYDGVRITAVIQGLGSRQSNAFTELCWNIPAQPSLRDQLFNLLASIPILLQTAMSIRLDCAQLTSDDDIAGSRGRGIDTLHGLLRAGSKLREWEVKVLETYGRHSSRSSGYAETLHSSTRLLYEECMLHDEEFFTASTQDWAACINICTTAQMLWAALSTLPDDGGQPLPMLPSWVDPQPYATYIAAVCHHFFRPEAGLWGAQGAIFPVSATLGYLANSGQRHDPRFKMILDSFKHSKSGLIMFDFLQSIMHRFDPGYRDSD